MLTAKDDEVDTIVGLECGADDYVAKPFSLRELLARVRAVLRRADRLRFAEATGERREEDVETLVSGDVAMNQARRQVTVGGAPVDLSPKEYQLLRVLMKRRGQVLSRDRLIQQVWGDDFMGDVKTLDVHIRWLRNKIEANPSDPRHIVTVRGAGYLFE
jgi:DNA-binding response OmpR family regulator